MLRNVSPRKYLFPVDQSCLALVNPTSISLASDKKPTHSTKLNPKLRTKPQLSPGPIIPYEILLQIFRFLPLRSLLLAAQVNSEWNLVSKDPSLWRHLAVHDSPLACHANDRSMSEFSKTLSHFESRLRNIRSLQVCYDSLVGNQLFWLCFHLPNLESIDLSHCPSLTDEIMDRLISQCRKLVNIRIFNCSKISADLLFPIVGEEDRGWKSLEFGFVRLNDLAMVEFIESRIFATLKKLSVSSVFELTERGFNRFIGALCKNDNLVLEELDLSGNYYLTPELMNDLSNCRALTQRLKKLNVENCDQLTRQEAKEFEEASGGSCVVATNALLRDNSEEAAREYIQLLMSS
ncbi:hypothetical protein BKA69DRAFT_1121265 [Paraphysoderma sedebokerense]|nr:hypothetical protein BKA69DRAFT_1121265 [Paraphysoderma sedebokerense]